MPAYLEGTTVDTSSIDDYGKTGMRLLKFVKTVYGDEVLKKLDDGELILWYNKTVVKYDDNFRNYRVHGNTSVNVKRKEDDKVPEIPEMFKEKETIPSF